MPTKINLFVCCCVGEGEKIDDRKQRESLECGGVAKILCFFRVVKKVDDRKQMKTVKVGGLVEVIKKKLTIANGGLVGVLPKFLNSLDCYK